MYSAYSVYYETSSMYPYYYHVSLVLTDVNGKKKLVERNVFTAWIDVTEYAEKYSAELVFDGII